MICGWDQHFQTVIFSTQMTFAIRGEEPDGLQLDVVFAVRNGFLIWLETRLLPDRRRLWH